MDAKKRIYFLAHGGVVQGVSFRYWTQEKAESYGLTGWVRNTRNNKVEGEAQGAEDAIAKLRKDLDDGPTHARVVKLDIQDRDIVDDESDFQLRSTADKHLVD